MDDPPYVQSFNRIRYNYNEGGGVYRYTLYCLSLNIAFHLLFLFIVFRSIAVQLLLAEWKYFDSLLLLRLCDIKSSLIWFCRILFFLFFWRYPTYIWIESHTCDSVQIYLASVLLPLPRRCRYAPWWIKIVPGVLYFVGVFVVGVVAYCLHTFSFIQHYDRNEIKTVNQLFSFHFYHNVGWTQYTYKKYTYKIKYTDRIIGLHLQRYTYTHTDTPTFDSY